MLINKYIDILKNPDDYLFSDDRTVLRYSDHDFVCAEIKRHYAQNQNCKDNNMLNLQESLNLSHISVLVMNIYFKLSYLKYNNPYFERHLSELDIAVSELNKEIETLLNSALKYYKDAIYLLTQPVLNLVKQAKGYYYEH